MPPSSGWRVNQAWGREQSLQRLIFTGLHGVITHCCENLKFSTILLGFEIFIATTEEFNTSRDMTSCSVVKVLRMFPENYFHLQGRKVSQTISK